MQTNFITKNKNVRIKSLTDNILSHHALGAFFSGQDIKTLQTEGNDTNCFVSLIVDTKGTYQAAITRKMKTEDEVITKSLGTSYEFFGDGPVTTDEDSMSEHTDIIQKEVIEYFMLNVQREEVTNPFDFLDKRFDEIAENKSNRLQLEPVHNFRYYPEEYTPFKEERTIKIEEPTLWDKETMDSMKVLTDWEPDAEVIHRAVVQMVLCSLIVNTDKVDLKQWVTKHMKNQYEKIFLDEEALDHYVEFAVDFQLHKLSNEFNDIEDYEMLLSYIANAIDEELAQYKDKSAYIKNFRDKLQEYIFY